MQVLPKDIYYIYIHSTYVLCTFLADCSGVSGTPGVYSIQVDHDNSVQAACLEGGWTVIQSWGQFKNPSGYFAKGWAEYKNGFGIPGR